MIIFCKNAFIECDYWDIIIHNNIAYSFSSPYFRYKGYKLTILVFCLTEILYKDWWVQ